ncbi:DIP1281 family NlpC/P60 protein [uncultured Corynebacterium sp.]|uniref:DIP1281 family NlpC/P60 protein n=1 Tax=uncultured Corynebacterium sp. TaxID=159447 RepID=UPI0025E14B88|nr:NlpC/P60 family protein [uncultured Corynebacterium sp.]
MALRLTSRGRARGSTARGTGALLTVAVTVALTTHTGTAAAEETSGTDAESYLTDLVSRVSDAEEQVNSLESELGGLRESVNKSRVDVERSVRTAQDAQDKVTDARSRLGDRESDLGAAQADLDEIARSAYSQGGDASAVPLAAGASADDAIDRASYIRLAAERQQAEVDRLDLARTQAANEESSLREARDNADGLVAAAQQARDAAQSQFDKVQQDLRDRADRHASLLADADAAREQLAAARAAVERAAKSDGSTSFDKRRAAEAAVAKVETAPTEATPPQQPPTETDKTPTTTNVTPSVKSEIMTEGAGDSSATAPADTTTTAAASSIPADIADGTDADAEVAEFSADTAGDDRRQAAINGLLGAAGAAAVAGVTADLNGGDPLTAAAAAARSSASQSYNSLPEETSGVGEDTGTVPGTGTSTDVPGGSTGDTSGQDASGTSAEKIERVINRGMSQLGVTYAWGGGDANGPTLGIRDGGVADAYGDYAKVGFDCSGLMVYAFNAVGIHLEHYSGYQYTAGTQVPVEQARRGDMLFWGIGGSGHVALYLGDGKMLEAPQSGDVVKVSDARWSGAMPYAVRMIE